MPKIKTSKSAVKRIAKVTKRGKVVVLKMSAQHLARRKSKRAKSKALNKVTVHSSNLKKIKKLIPNSGV